MSRSESWRRVVRLLISGALLSFALPAQHSNGYLFVAPGGYTCCHNNSTTLQFGVGGEYVMRKGLGVGAEVGGVGVTEAFGDSLLGVASINGYYHFARGETIRADPFVTGGYTLMFRSGHANLGNFGAGLNYWFYRRLAARLEFRDQLTTSGTTAHFWGVRFGVAFR